MAKRAKKIIMAAGVLVAAAGFVVLPSLAADSNGGAAGTGRGAGPGVVMGSGPGGGGGPGIVIGSGPGAGNGQRGAGPQDGGQKNGAQTASFTGTVFAVRTSQAKTGDLQAYIEVNGNVVSSSQIVVTPDVSGRIAAVNTEIGQVVRKGALLAQVDPSRPGSVYELNPVYAPVSGIIVNVAAAMGANIVEGQTLLTIAVDNRVEIEALIPERNVGLLVQGLRAEVSLEAYPGITFAASVSTVSPVLDPVSRTKKITLAFDRNDPRINAGMFARVKLNTTRYRNVVSVPSEALVEKGGKSGVYLLDGGDAAVFQEIVPGVSIDGATEIRSGLSGGEKVVIQGQQYLSDGARVRDIS
jgi:multidrug efflux pump subunit AcrA (membrane-fusion protein)